MLRRHVGFGKLTRRWEERGKQGLLEVCCQCRRERDYGFQGAKENQSEGERGEITLTR